MFKCNNKNEMTSLANMSQTSSQFTEKRARLTDEQKNKKVNSSIYMKF